MTDSSTRKPVRPKSVDNTSTSRKNIKATIEELYQSDWFTFAPVNVVSNLYAKPKFNIVSETEQGVELWEKFFLGMRQYGNNTSLKRLRADIKKDSVRYGAGYLEFIPSEEGDEILDLKRVDAAKLNKAKTASGKLILDTLGNSIGYVMSLGANADLRSTGDIIPSPYLDKK